MSKTLDKNTALKRTIAFPQMGNISIPVAGMLKAMGANVRLSEQNNKETLTLGTRYSPETICLPYKLNLGNYIQALESGASVLIMFQAPGTCRLGNYANLAEAKLVDLGYDFEMIVFDMYKGKLVEISKKFSQAVGGCPFTRILKGIAVGFSKFNALDQIERKLFYYRPREIKSGTAELIYNKARKLIDDAMTVDEVNKAVSDAFESYSCIKIDEKRDILKVYLTGEFFALLDPFTNLEIEKELGLLGVEVDRQVMLSDWTNGVLLPKFVNKKESHRERAIRIAGKYIKRAIGGECLESIGDTIQAARSDVDGVIHIGPFGCMPEIVTQCILPHVSKEENIPVISLILDEQTGKAGFVTRLEAFVDLLRRRKRSIKTEIK